MSEPRPCPFCADKSRATAECWWCKGRGTLSEDQEMDRRLDYRMGVDGAPRPQISAESWAAVERMRNGEIMELDDGRGNERREQDRMLTLELTEHELLHVLACIRVHGRGGQIPPKARRDYLENLLDDQWEDQHPFSCL